MFLHVCKVDKWNLSIHVSSFFSFNIILREVAISESVTRQWTSLQTTKILIKLLLLSFGDVKTWDIPNQLGIKAERFIYDLLTSINKALYP